MAATRTKREADARITKLALAMPTAGDVDQLERATRGETHSHEAKMRCLVALRVLADDVKERAKSVARLRAVMDRIAEAKGVMG